MLLRYCFFRVNVFSSVWIDVELECKYNTYRIVLFKLTYFFSVYDE